MLLNRLGKSQVAVNEAGIPLVSRARGTAGSANTHAAQTIVSIDHEIWEGLKRRYPHRKEPLIRPLEDDDDAVVHQKRRRQDDDKPDEGESPSKRARTQESVSQSEESSAAPAQRKRNGGRKKTVADVTNVH